MKKANKKKKAPKVSWDCCSVEIGHAKLLAWRYLAISDASDKIYPSLSRWGGMLSENEDEVNTWALLEAWFMATSHLVETWLGKEPLLIPPPRIKNSLLQ